MPHVYEGAAFVYRAAMEIERSGHYHTLGRFRRGQVRALKPTKLVLDYLFVLFIHRTVPSFNLHALANPGRNVRRTSDFLHLMRNPPNDWVLQPEGLRRRENAKSGFLAYEISDKGARLLVDHHRITPADYALWRKLRQNYKAHHFEHDLATGYTTSSIELGCRARGLRFISWLDIFNRDRCPPSTRAAENPIAIPYEANGVNRQLIMDDLCGVAHRDHGAYFMAIETDMGSEQHKELPFNGVTTIQKLKAYRNVLAKGEPKRLFGIAELQLCIATTGLVRAQNMKGHLVAVAAQDRQGSTRNVHFKVLPDLAFMTRKTLPPLDHMLTPWSRAQNKEFDFTVFD